MSNQLAVYSRIFRDDKYVDIMIKSVLNQDYKDFDFFILVNNNTVKTIEKYAAADTRIKILRAKSPTDGSQNYYKDIALTHKYIFTVDGDDWLDLKCFSKMLAFAQRNSLEIVACGNNFCKNGKIIGQRCLKTVYRANKQTALYNLKYIYQFFRTFWGKMWDCKLFALIDEIPTSLEYGGYGGDTLACFCLLDKSDSIGVMPECLYNYRCNDSSASHQLKKGRLKSDVALFEYVYNILKSNNAQTSDNILFLIQVYLNATIDSMKLIKEADLSSKEKAEAYQELFSNKLFTGLRDKGSINEPIKQFFLCVFNDVNFKDIEEYVDLTGIFYPKWKGKITSELLQIILQSPELLSYYTSCQTNSLSAALINYLNSPTATSNISVCYSVIEFVMSNSDDQLLLDTLKNKDFSLKHINLIDYIAQKNYYSACDYCRSHLEKEDKYIYEIIEAYLNCAAINQDSASFIHAKVFLYYVKMSEGATSDAQKLFNELLEMGLSEEDLSM